MKIDISTKIGQTIPMEYIYVGGDNKDLLLSKIEFIKIKDVNIKDNEPFLTFEDKNGKLFSMKTGGAKPEFEMDLEVLQKKCDKYNSFNFKY